MRLESFTSCLQEIKMDPILSQGAILARGYSPENMIQVLVALKTPFSRPPDHSLRPHFIIFQFFQDPTLPEITNFWKICISEPQNRGKVQFLHLEFGHKFQFQEPQLDKKNQFV